MKRLLPFIAAAVAGAAALALAGLLLGSAEEKPASPAVWTAPDQSFSIATPKGWKVTAHGPAATVIERADRRGSAVIRPRGEMPASMDRFARGLTRSLRKQLDDFKPLTSRAAAVGTGQALVYTFVRPKANRVQSIVVAPAGERAYSLDLVAAGDAPDVARELGGIVKSFKPMADSGS